LALIIFYVYIFFNLTRLIHKSIKITTKYNLIYKGTFLSYLFNIINLFSIIFSNFFLLLPKHLKKHFSKLDFNFQKFDLIRKNAHFALNLNLFYKYLNDQICLYVYNICSYLQYYRIKIFNESSISDVI